MIEKKTKIKIHPLLIILLCIVLFFMYLSGMFTYPYTENQILGIVSNEVNSSCQIISKEITEKLKKETTYILKDENGVYYRVTSSIFGNSLFPQLPKKRYSIYTFPKEEYEVGQLESKIRKEINKIAKKYGYNPGNIPALYISIDNASAFYNEAQEVIESKEYVDYIERENPFDLTFIIHYTDYSLTSIINFRSFVKYTN